MKFLRNPLNSILNNKTKAFCIYFLNSLYIKSGKIILITLLFNLYGIYYTYYECSQQTWPIWLLITLPVKKMQIYNSWLNLVLGFPVYSNIESLETIDSVYSNLYFILISIVTWNLWHYFDSSWKATTQEESNSFITFF